MKGAAQVAPFPIMHNIDCHILTQSDNPLLDRCLTSLNGQPINIHYASPVDGDLRKARTDGYLIGNADYVSYVDPDDIVMPEAYQQCLNALSKNPNLIGAICLKSSVLPNGQEQMQQYRPWSKTSFIEYGLVWCLLFDVKL